MVTRLRAAAELKLKLVGHYLPTLKAVEHSGEGGEELVVQVMRFTQAENLPPVPDDGDDTPAE
jgi:hypothetical protein